MKTGSDRRRFLKGAAMATAGASMLGATDAVANAGAATLSSLAADVVVGAGFAGMVAALRLRQMGHSVIVVDAMNRVGGRSWATTLSDGTFVDIGAGWTGSTQHHILGLISELGLSTYTQYGLGAGEGDSLFVGLGGQSRRFRGLGFPIGAAAQAEIAAAILSINELAKTVPLNAPWTAPDAADWDNISAGVFAAGLVTDPAALAVVMGNLTTIFGLSPFAVSFLHLLWESHSAGGVEKFGPGEGGSVQYRIVGGTQQIPLAIVQPPGAGRFPPRVTRTRA